MTSETSDSTGENPPFAWPCVIYRDAPAAIRFLADTFGFVSTSTIVDQNDETVVHHAELLWPEGGGVMLGSTGRPESPFSEMPTGAASIYVVTDQPDDVFKRASDAGAEIVRGHRDEDYGSRGFTARDPEGNLWSFGTYRGQPLPRA
jgi:uncharacterized glyoxalase superfamily protein PhnB